MLTFKERLSKCTGIFFLFMYCFPVLWPTLSSIYNEGTKRYQREKNDIRTKDMETK